MIPASGAGGREFDSRITPFPEDRHSSLGVEHSLSKRKVVGSNPACGFFFFFERQKNKDTRNEDRTRDLVRVRHA